MAALVNELVRKPNINSNWVAVMAALEPLLRLDRDRRGWYVPLAEVGAEFLFQVIAERAERNAVIMTTNLPFSEWTQVIPKCPALQSAADRIHGPRSHSGDGNGIISLPAEGPKGRKEENLQMRNELRKWLSVESLESQKQASHPFHRPWKAAKERALTFPQLRRLVPYIRKELSKAATRGPHRIVSRNQRVSLCVLDRAESF